MWCRGLGNRHVLRQFRSFPRTEGARLLAQMCSMRRRREGAFNAFHRSCRPRENRWRAWCCLRGWVKRPEGSSSGRLAESSSRPPCTSLGADDSVMLPPEPLATSIPRPLAVGLLDEHSDPGEHLAPPIAQLLDSRIDQPRGRIACFSFLRTARRLLHGGCRFLHGCCRSPAAHILSPGNWLACLTQAAS